MGCITGIDHRHLLIYVHHQMTTNLNKIKEKDDEWERLEAEEEEKARNPESCLIIPKAPKRIGVIQKAKKVYHSSFPSPILSLSLFYRVMLPFYSNLLFISFLRVSLQLHGKRMEMK